MKGIPSRVPTSGFRSPALTPNSMANRTPISSRIRKDGGIKLLDINEQPLGYAQAKKRRRMMELEEQQKKVAEAQAAAAAAATATPAPAEASTTPEYAQGLAPINPPATPVTTGTPAATYVPAGTTTAVTPTPTTPQTRKFQRLTNYSRKSFYLHQSRIDKLIFIILASATPLPTTPVAAATPAPTTPVESTPVGVQTVRPAQTVTQIRIQTTAQPANATANTRKGLSLTVNIASKIFAKFLLFRIDVTFLVFRYSENKCSKLRRCSGQRTKLPGQRKPLFLDSWLVPEVKISFFIFILRGASPVNGVFRSLRG